LKKEIPLPMMHITDAEDHISTDVSWAAEKFKDPMVQKYINTQQMKLMHA
jgi:hypothetical protein